jgi:hypothetical protein
VDMTKYTTTDGSDFKLRRHTEAIRRNKDIIAHVFIHLSSQPPNASAAKEAFDELPYDDQIAAYSCSTKDGGVWETWERDAIFYGRLDETNAYAVWQRRFAHSTAES